MQLLVAISKTSEEYYSQGLHATIRRPKQCPHCMTSHSLLALGYYSRFISKASLGTVIIRIRRFRCFLCRKTISILPSFAQPYRIVRNSTIQAGISTRRNRLEVLRWREVINGYWRRFCIWLPELVCTIGSYCGRSPPKSEPAAWWFLLVSSGGGLEEVTMQLVRDFKITLFGKYQCHFPNPPV